MNSIDKFLITGFSGFVSKHFLDYLENNEISAHVVGVDINEPTFKYKHFKYVTCDFKKLDLLNKTEVEDVVGQFRPDYVLHLASFSSVAYSWENPINSFANNTNIYLSLIEIIRHLKIDCRILSIGSSEEYGNVNEGDLPLVEERMLQPVSPYAVARVSQEMLSKVYADSYGLDIIMTRSFNHIGTHQKDVFVIPSFAKQLIELKRTDSLSKIITTGDTSIVRDFVDVRAVVEAYYFLFKKGKRGEVYNICNGEGVSLNEVIQIMASVLDIEITQKVDAQLVRPNDNKIIIGSNKKIKKDTGWNNAYTLKQSIKDILEYYQSTN